MANGLGGNDNQDIDVLMVFTMILDTLNAFKFFEIGTDHKTYNNCDTRYVMLIFMGSELSENFITL